jgi:hypothetical protein
MMREVCIGRARNVFTRQSKNVAPVHKAPQGREPVCPCVVVSPTEIKWERNMPFILWLLGVPLTLVLVLWLLGVI